MIKILILCDEVDIGNLYSFLLHKEYENIDVFRFHQESLPKIYDYDLVVIDIQNFSSIAFLKTLDPHKAFRPKIITISPFNSGFGKKAIEEIEFIDLTLIKPLASNKFLEVIKNFDRDIVNHYVLKEKNDVLIDFFNNSPFRVAIFDLDGNMFFCNAKYINALVTKDMWDVNFDSISKCDYKFEDIKSRLLLSESTFSIDKEEKDTKLWFRSTFYRLHKNFIVHKCEDITRDITAKENLRQSSIFFENANEGILVTDEKGNILSANNAFSKITGFSVSEVMGKNPSILQSGIHKNDFYASMWDSLKFNGTWQGEIWNKRKHGEIYPEWLSISKVEDNQSITKKFYIAIFTDITNLKEADKKIYFYANHDHLTGLANRLNIESRFSHSLDIAKRKKQKVALLFIDIDNFKDINDTYSHAVGDEIIKKVANRISQNIREEDTLGRIGGDEFLVVLGDIDEESNVVELTKKLMESIKEPININNEIFYITLSIGIAIYPEHGENTDTLKQNADLAMYKVKENGRNGYGIYDANLSDDLKIRVTIIGELRSALQNSELEVYYQPIIDYKTDKIISAEALIRWFHPQKGAIAPMDFIPLAEEKGLISEITAEVFHTVLRDLERINLKLDTKNFKIAINISARDFFSKNFTQNLLGYFEGFDVEYSQIELEITETQIMKNYTVAMKIIEKLKVMGFRFAIDDFGTGYSSLNYLKYFNIDKLKIDKSFILDAPYDEDDAMIAKTIVDIAKTFKLQVQAEGVEEFIHEEFVKSIGCDFGQGYFYAKPIKFKDFYDLIDE